jgi:natural product biosynthesis luciferase-like monooxygenase protein
MQFAAYAMPSHRPEFPETPGAFLRATVDHLASAEALGFDSVWVNEHHFHEYGGMMPALPIMLASLAQRTSRLRLGTSVVVLPLHHPLEVAEQLAMVDLLSEGRVEFGVGRGFVTHDYEVMHIPHADAQARLIEALEVIRKAWTQRPFDHDGTYFKFSNVELWPLPHQRPHPPIWIACSGTPSSFEWTGAQGHKLLTIGYLRPVEKLAGLTDLYRQSWADAGHPHRPTIATHYHTVVAENRADARRIAESALAEHVRLNRLSQALSHSAPPAANEGISIDQLVDEARLIAGDPDDCAALLRRIGGAIGCDEAHCMFQFGNIPISVAQRSMELFGTEVIPRLRTADLVGGAAER